MKVNRLVKDGDKVIFSKPEANINKEVGVVNEANPTDKFQLAYFGEGHIVVKRKNGELIAVQKEDCEPYVEKSRDNDIRVGEAVTLKIKQKNMNKLFYPVVENNGEKISLYNDKGYRVLLNKKDVEKVDLDDWFKYMINIDERMHKLENLVINSFDLIKDDIGNSLRSYKL